jgi:hypothetical protein
MVLRVTFDTNTFERIVYPEKFSETPAYHAINAAIKDGRIRGFFSEAVVALDAYEKDIKVTLLESARFRSEALSTGNRNITIQIGAQWGMKPPISDKFLDRLRALEVFGMRALIGPRRLGDLHPLSGDLVTYERHQSVDELIARGEKTNTVDLALSRRGLGRAKVINLGVKFSERNGTSGEWWPLGIRRSRNSTERKKVWEAICEWADGDAIAAHVGYGNDIFCTEDMGSNSGSRSALHPINRAWIGAEFGVVFMSLLELVGYACPTQIVSES